MKKILVCTLMALSLYVSPVKAGGIPVIDSANLSQNVLTAIESIAQTIKQIEEYATQVQQYEDQIKNSLAPYAYVWARAQDVYHQIQSLQYTYLNYIGKYGGGIDGYVSKYMDTNMYRTSPYFTEPAKAKDMREAQLKALMEGEERGSEVQKAANDATARLIEQQDGSMLTQSLELERLQAEAMGAEGRLQAIQFTNQMLSQLNGQFLELRSAFLSQMQAQNVRLHTIADREARQRIAEEKHYDDTKLKQQINIKGKSW